MNQLLPNWSLSQWKEKVIAPNVADKDELTTAQAQILELQFAWSFKLWLEAIRTELTSLIITNDVFESVKIDDVPIEMQYKIFNLLILLNRKSDECHEFTKYKARLVMEGSHAQIGVDVFDTYATLRMFQFNIELGLKPVAGHPCLFIRITALEGQIFVIVMGIFVNDLLVTENSVAEIKLVRDRYISWQIKGDWNII